MGKLRDQMLEDMQLRRLRPNTCVSYLQCVRRLAQVTGRSPDQLDTEQVRAFLLDLVKTRKASPSTQAVYTAAFRFFFDVTAGKPEVMRPIRSPRRSKWTLPVILSGSEVERLLEAAPSLKHRACSMLAYGAGLRISEIVDLRVEDIDGPRQLLRIRDAKGGKDRYSMLSPRLLEGLRAYYREARPQGPYLFPGRRPGTAMTKNAVRKALYQAVRRAGIKKRVSPHVLRHAFASHLIELGASSAIVQVLLGHQNHRTTERYIHVSRDFLGRLKSPLDVIGTKDASVLG